MPEPHQKQIRRICNAVPHEALAHAQLIQWHCRNDCAPDPKIAFKTFFASGKCHSDIVFMIATRTIGNTERNFESWSRCRHYRSGMTCALITYGNKIKLPPLLLIAHSVDLNRERASDFGFSAMRNAHLECAQLEFNLFVLFLSLCDEHFFTRITLVVCSQCDTLFWRMQFDCIFFVIIRKSINSIWLKWKLEKKKQIAIDEAPPWMCRENAIHITASPRWGKIVPNYEKNSN